LSGRTCLVTGGGGFIGSHLVDALLDRGDAVRVLDDWSNGNAANMESRNARLDVLSGDIRDLDLVSRCASGCDIVFHQAALGSVPRSLADPGRTHDVNVNGSFTVFRAAWAAKVARVVFASSSSVYGDHPGLPKVEENLGTPLSPYAASKRATEVEAAGIARSYGMTFVGLRYFNVYGPRQRADSPYAAVIPLFFQAALRGLSPRIHGDGAQSRDFTFVSDVVEANLLAAAAPIPPGSAPVFNVSRGERVTITELWQAIAKETGAGVEPEHVAPRPGDVRHSLASLEAARRDLFYRPRIALAEGLARSAPSYRSLYGQSAG
jgi:nucleoside-diphosphate-sugar epimerase